MPVAEGPRRGVRSRLGCVAALGAEVRQATLLHGVRCGSRNAASHQTEFGLDLVPRHVVVLLAVHGDFGAIESVLGIAEPALEHTRIDDDREGLAQTPALDGARTRWRE